MKKLFTVLFLLMSIGSSILSASEAESKLTELNYYSTSWTGDEDSLYFNINLSDELRFTDTYYTSKMKDGQACEIICSPLKGHQILSPKGYPLQKATFLVEVKNTKNPKQLSYKLTSKFFYEVVKKNVVISSETRQITNEGIISTPAVDLTEDPVFFVTNEEFSEGYVVFKNSFPCSSM